MDVKSIIAEIDAEISKLQDVKASLSGLSGSATSPLTRVKSAGRGRPKGSKNTPKPAAAAAKTAAPAKAAKSSKRKLSPEGRKAIADAMKRRWAERRKETAK
jgi:hypothetical protein